MGAIILIGATTGGAAAFVWPRNLPSVGDSDPSSRCGHRSPPDWLHGFPVYPVLTALLECNLSRTQEKASATKNGRTNITEV